MKEREKKRETFTPFIKRSNKEERSQSVFLFFCTRRLVTPTTTNTGDIPFRALRQRRQSTKESSYTFSFYYAAAFPPSSGTKDGTHKRLIISRISLSFHFVDINS